MRQRDTERVTERKREKKIERGTEAKKSKTTEQVGILERERTKNSMTKKSLYNLHCLHNSDLLA